MRTASEKRSRFSYIRNATEINITESDMFVPGGGCFPALQVQ